MTSSQSNLDMLEKRIDSVVEVLTRELTPWAANYWTTVLFILTRKLNETKWDVD